MRFEKPFGSMHQREELLCEPGDLMGGAP